MNNFILEETEQGDVATDIYTKLADDRILMIHDVIDDKQATDIVAALMIKDAENNEEKISLLINSPGGDIRSIFMIYDTIRLLSSPVETVCIGEAMEEAALILAAGDPGMRFATENAIICVGQLTADMQMYSDISDAVNHMERLKKDNRNFITALAKCVKKPFRNVMKDLERKRFLSATQSKTYGLIDGIVKTVRK